MLRDRLQAAGGQVAPYMVNGLYEASLYGSLTMTMLLYFPMDRQLIKL